MTVTGRVLLRSPLANISDYTCSTPKSGPGRERCGALSSITIIRRGVHAYQARGQTTLALPGMALLYRGGEPYCLSHPYERPVPDRSTCIEFGPALLDEAFGSKARVRNLGTHLAPRTQFVALQARSMLAIGPHEQLAAEETAMELVRTIAADFHVLPSECKAPAAARRRVERARAFIAAAPTADRSLEAVADAAACSPFHLARLFKRHTGMTIRQYRLRLRLGMALDELAGGATDLSNLAVRVGFSDHSHMTASFKKVFGSTPSALREQLKTGRLTQMSKFLQAPCPVRT